MFDLDWMLLMMTVVGGAGTLSGPGPEQPFVDIPFLPKPVVKLLQLCCRL
ncbi:hypothetical protein ACFSOZ_13705 [Mesorhizobium newzealandense]|uniref:Uncharacterized protein n=1 Tax=Mesorhizobium newzealandense TaxID=1300302 RepID=A0ABW4U9T7_9HYPH